MHQAADSTGQPVSVMISRHVLPERRADFEQSIRAWIPQATSFPGHLGVFMLKPAGHSTEYGALLRFRSWEDWRRFSAWEPYCRFLAEIRPMLKQEPASEHLHGLEAWFTPQGGAGPPRWKMALLTWIGVNVMVWLASRLIATLGSGWPAGLRFLATTTLVVVALTWVVMPYLTHWMRAWLHDDHLAVPLRVKEIDR